MTNDFSSEQIYVAALFREHFEGMKDKPLVLYGIGRNTEAIVALCPEIKIAGLMDSKAAGEKFGLRLLSHEEAAEISANIIIVARDSALPIIYERIAALEGMGCQIFCVNGKRAKASEKYEGEELEYWSVGIDELKGAIDKAKHVSFDIFDTIIGRRRLLPIEKRDMEAERETVYLRRDIKEAFLYAAGQGKSLSLISDTFYKADELRSLLSHAGLDTDAPIYASCEIGSVKEDGGLYRYYLEHLGCGAEDCLHIGDNRYADGLEAGKLGINTFSLMSGYSMLESSAARMLLSGENSKEYNEALGIFVSEALSSPFALKGSKGYLPAGNLYDLGYLYIAPLVCAFLKWLKQKINEHHIDKMLFPSRDGYIFFKCYEIMRSLGGDLPGAVYFKTSRRCVTVAAIESFSDIKRIAERVFHGTAGEFFMGRFGINAEEKDAHLPWEAASEQAEALLRKYEAEILENAKAEREDYLNYLEGLKLHGQEVGFFDFVSSGTVQYYFERLTGKKVLGLYCATNNLPNGMYKPGEIEAAFGNITSYGGGSPFSRHYTALESIFTDSDPTLVKYEKAGPLFYGTNNSYKSMSEAHRGIIDYFEKHFTSPHPPGFAERLIGELFGGSVRVSGEVKKCFRNDDIYDGVGEYGSFNG